MSAISLIHAMLAASYLAIITLSVTLASPVKHSPDLFVSSFFNGNIQRFYGPLSAHAGNAHPAPGHTAAFYATGVARRPWGIAFGPSGDLFVANQQGGDGGIMRLRGPFSDSPGAPHPLSGQPQTSDIFVSSPNFNSLAFGLDQNLYAGAHGAIQRFDIATGEAIGPFTSGRVPSEVRGISFGPDKNLYVSSYNPCFPGPLCTGTLGEILRFDGKSGAFIDVFVANGTSDLREVGGIDFGPGGDLFVCNQYIRNTATGEVLRFRGPFGKAPGSPYPAAGHSGAQFVTMERGASPFNLAFGPDRSLYVVHDQGIHAYNGRSGVFMRNFASVPSARGLAFYTGDK